LTLIDGVRETMRALAGGAVLREVFALPEVLSGSEASALLERLGEESISVVELGRDAFEKLAYGDRLDGGVAVAETPPRTLDELVGYCRCVAGSVGRLSLGVFNPPLSSADFDGAAQLADALGVALQLTNILRDVREDLGNGRVYLPKRDLDLFDCELGVLPDGTLDPQDGALAEVIRFEAARAWGWYDRGLRLLDVLDRRSAACCAAMSGIYRELLQRIAADPGVVMRGRLSLSTRAKLRVAGGSLARRGGRRG